MGEFNVNDYLIITDVTKVNGLEDMNFASWYPYKIESITENTITVKNGKHTFIFTPLEMQHVIKANENHIEKAFTKFKKGDKLIVPDVNRLLFGDALDITSGKEYEVYDVDPYGLPIIRDNYNGRLGFLKEDLLFINRIEALSNEEVEADVSKLIEQYKVGDSVVLTNLDKFKDARGLKFYLNAPYEIVNVLKQIKAIVIKNNLNRELIISKEELRYIKPFVDTKMIEEVHKFIEELETKHIKHNVNVMIDVALKERNFERLKEIVDMGLKFD